MSSPVVFNDVLTPFSPHSMTSLSLFHVIQDDILGHYFGMILRYFGMKIYHFLFQLQTEKKHVLEQKFVMIIGEQTSYWSETVFSQFASKKVNDNKFSSQNIVISSQNNTPK